MRDIAVKEGEEERAERDLAGKADSAEEEKGQGDAEKISPV